MEEFKLYENHQFMFKNSKRFEPDWNHIWKWCRVHHLFYEVLALFHFYLHNFEGFRNLIWSIDYYYKQSSIRLERSDFTKHIFTYLNFYSTFRVKPAVYTNTVSELIKRVSSQFRIKYTKWLEYHISSSLNLDGRT